jgi:hypothetical protein
MEKLSVVLLAVFLILCIRQLYFTEPFVEADIKNATVTMSLSDMLYYSGNKGAVQYSLGNTSGGSQRLPSIYEDTMGYYGSSGGSGGNLGSYLYLKNEMTKQFKEHIKHTQADTSFQATNVEPPSCMQGSSYMETVPLKVPASCSQ